MVAINYQTRNLDRACGELIRGSGCATPKLKGNITMHSDITNAPRNCQIWCASLNLAEGNCCEWHPKENTCGLFKGGLVPWINTYAAACTDGRSKKILNASLEIINSGIVIFIRINFWHLLF